MTAAPRPRRFRPGSAGYAKAARQVVRSVLAAEIAATPDNSHRRRPLEHQHVAFAPRGSRRQNQPVRTAKPKHARATETEP